jgi:hypothetical protein
MLKNAFNNDLKAGTDLTGTKQWGFFSFVENNLLLF